LECASKLLMTRPLDKSHHFTVLSQLPDKAVLPSGENATEVTDEECPSCNTTLSTSGGEISQNGFESLKYFCH